MTPLSPKIWNIGARRMYKQTLLFLSFFKTIYLFIFGCAGSSLLRELFSSRSAWALIAVSSPVAEHRL